MAGIKCLLSFPFLQVTGDPVPVQDDQLVQHLVPVAVPLCPFLYDVPTGQVQHFLQCRVTREHTFSFRHLPILAVQPLYNISCIHYPAYVIRKLEKWAYIFPVVLPITDRIRVFPSPFSFMASSSAKAAVSFGALYTALKSEENFFRSL